jgi:hypothetical protein
MASFGHGQPLTKVEPVTPTRATGMTIVRRMFDTAYVLLFCIGGKLTR